MPEQKIVIDLSRALIKTYKLRPSGTNSPTVESAIPREPLEREARTLGIPFEEFMERYEAVWHYDGFPGLYLTFQEKPQRKESGA
ncbi:MAG TPA: hypothetical protein VMW64_01010 [Dehalococcoidia bacterium]|nr:hypothetical protein [Dehalococcoidia bacterium]